MARLVWVGIGAVGGIYAYRKGERALTVVREQGVAGTVQVVATATLHSLVALRSQPQDQTGVLVATGERSTGLRVGRFRIYRAEEAGSSMPAIMGSEAIDITTAASPERAGAGDASGARRGKAN